MNETEVWVSFIIRDEVLTFRTLRSSCLDDAATLVRMGAGYVRLMLEEWHTGMATTDRTEWTFYRPTPAAKSSRRRLRSAGAR